MSCSFLHQILDNNGHDFLGMLYLRVGCAVRIQEYFPVAVATPSPSTVYSSSLEQNNINFTIFDITKAFDCIQNKSSA